MGSNGSYVLFSSFSDVCSLFYSGVTLYFLNEFYSTWLLGDSTLITETGMWFIIWFVISSVNNLLLFLVFNRGCRYISW